MSNLSQHIKSAEAKWLVPVKQQLISLYHNVHLPSHDISHHERVWDFCKQLMAEINSYGECIDDNLVEQLLVASLFHDTGLIKDKSEKHGYQSRIFCVNFFEQNPKLQLNDIECVLHAIEHHDDKSLKAQPGIVQKPSTDILTLLSTADDLDAFGYVGVFRYLEIYLLRGIAFKAIPKMVMDNITNRLTNFSNNYSMLSSFHDNQVNRYYITHRFYSELALEQAGSFPGDYSSITELLVKHLVNDKNDVKTAITHGLLSLQSPVLIDFFISLKEELEL
ncbi:MAG: HD domain-containing protein [Bacteroidales bacterium]